MAYDSSNPSDFHTDEYKSKITSIVTKGDTIIPEGVIESWDISEKQNGSVIAYIEDDGTGAGTYKVTIGGEGSIIANYDMSSYFSELSNVKFIDLSYMDTSLTTDMMFMFGSFTPNTTLNKIVFGDNFDTSNVTDMTMMFSELENLTELDLSNFDTSNVTNMYAMFWYCSKLETLDISSFDTSKVTAMRQMFNHCQSLTKLDLSSFDTSNVTEYTSIFTDTPKLTEILVTRDKWTIPNSAITNSGVTDFTYV